MPQPKRYVRVNQTQLKAPDPWGHLLQLRFKGFVFDARNIKRGHRPSFSVLNLNPNLNRPGKIKKKIKIEIRPQAPR